MKFLLVGILFGFLALTAAEPFFVPGQNRRCPDFCTELYNPVCAWNVRCTALFGNPCKLDDWNCRTARREEIFIAADNSKCAHLNRYNNIQCRPV
ncbi:uncharacterized protein LOC129947952 [Eupeodes corollae]|uniref:uncharacterized protein LOC129947952 n=1 Tax=Eupeodes corollae TaxID=290404 RepID=UPI00248FC87F|nr:uncharacterized protein LOC129947952 [Eupeodes corollae]